MSQTEPMLSISKKTAANTVNVYKIKDCSISQSLKHDSSPILFTGDKRVLSLN